MLREAGHRFQRGKQPLPSLGHLEASVCFVARLGRPSRFRGIQNADVVALWSVDGFCNSYLVSKMRGVVSELSRKFVAKQVIER